MEVIKGPSLAQKSLNLAEVSCYRALLGLNITLYPTLLNKLVHWCLWPVISIYLDALLIGLDLYELIQEKCYVQCHLSILFSIGVI